MTVKELLPLIEGTACVLSDGDRDVTGVYCCDMLSHAMGRAPEGAAWVTVMGSLNAVAVASLTDVAVLIVAEGLDADRDAADRAETEGINIIKTPLSIFEAAKRIDIAVSEACTS